MENLERSQCPVLAARADILREWEEISRRTFPASSDKARGELRDHLPQLLENLCDALAGAGDGDAERLSRIHGRQRFSFGDFTLAQILGEYKLLKEIVIRHDAPSRDRLSRVMRIAGFFDDACATAATEFVDLRERELREAGDRLTLANDELARFTGVVAHDLRSPLATVLGYAEVIAEQPLPEPARKHLAIITATTARSVKLIDRLLEYTRVVHASPRFVSVDLDEVWASARQNLAGEFGAAGARVIPSRLGHACGDPVLLGQVAQNLMANSLKFRAPDRPCEISVTRARGEAGFVEITLRDNGVGFAPEQSEEIFRPFRTAHRRAEYAGSGLGLATCQRVIEAHGGRIWARGEIGRGATFHFTLRDECVN